MQSAAQQQKLSRSQLMARHAADFEVLIQQVRVDLVDDHFTAVMGKFREAVNLSRVLPETSEKVVKLGIELAEQALPRVSALSECILNEAAQVDSGKWITEKLWKTVHQREREEAMGMAGTGSEWASWVEPEFKAPVVRAEPKADLPVRLVDAVLIDGEQFKGALQRLTQIFRLDSHRLATAATILFTVATLSLTGGLIWMHSAHHEAPLAAASEDDRAWSSVNPGDLDVVEDYLNRFPGGAHRVTAVQALSNIRVERRQSVEVQNVLRQYVAAWNSRDVDSLIALQRNLNRQVVQKQLAPLQSMDVNLSDLSTPRIEGDQATVRCMRTVAVVYHDGIIKQSPAQNVTFVLTKHDGAWTIESARQTF